VSNTNLLMHSEDANLGLYLFISLVYDVDQLFTMGYVGQLNIKAILDFKNII